MRRECNGGPTPWIVSHGRRRESCNGRSRRRDVLLCAWLRDALYPHLHGFPVTVPDRRKRISVLSAIAATICGSILLWYSPGSADRSGLVRLTVAFPPSGARFTATFVTLRTGPHYVGLQFPDSAVPPIDAIRAALRGHNPDTQEEPAGFSWTIRSGDSTVAEGSTREGKVERFGSTIGFGRFHGEARHEYAVTIQPAPRYPLSLASPPVLEIGAAVSTPADAVRIAHAVFTDAVKVFGAVLLLLAMVIVLLLWKERRGAAE